MLAAQCGRCIGLANFLRLHRADAGANDPGVRNHCCENFIVFHVEHFVLANLCVQLYTYIS
jgi:hypothetical protein